MRLGIIGSCQKNVWWNENRYDHIPLYRCMGFPRIKNMILRRPLNVRHSVLFSLFSNTTFMISKDSDE